MFYIEQVMKRGVLYHICKEHPKALAYYLSFTNGNAECYIQKRVREYNESVCKN